MIRRTLLCVVVLGLCGLSAFGQSNNATLTGTVADLSGAVLPGVTITATNTSTNVATTAVTNESGAYTILGLIPGTYTVSGELPGFQKPTYQGVVLGNAVTVRLNFTLQVAALNTSVEVTIEADVALATSSG